MAIADAVIAQLASRQHGVVAVWQLRGQRVSEHAVLRRVADARLYCLYRGVYAVGHSHLTPEGRCLAAVLAYGPHAVLSHRSAAALRDIRATSRSCVDVSIPGPSPRSRPGIDAHGTAKLRLNDVTIVDAIPVTSLARTLLDLADVVSPLQLQRAYERAEELRILDTRALRELVDRSNGRRGVGVLRDLLGYDPAAAAEPSPSSSASFST
jgi:predicted transcriptional regulator of viral defense system